MAELTGEITDSLAGPADQNFPLRLAQLAGQWPEPVTLVIDDVQELTGSESQAGLDLLVRRGPPTLRLLLAGRHVAGLSIARLRVSGEVTEIGAGDLACTVQETTAYFDMLGVELPEARLDALLERTEGWMTGLRLAAMRSGCAGESGVPWLISGDEPRVADYLRDEVLGALPPDLRDFLLRTCVADPVCGDLADTLTSGEGGTEILDQLCRENLMTRPADGANGADCHGLAEYRYHPLLLDLLRALLRRELPAELPLLTKQAATWQAGHGQYGDALANAAQAGEWDFAAGVLAEAGPLLLLARPASALEPVLASFPAGRYTRDAQVAGALAAAGLRTGDAWAAELHLDNATAALPRCPGDQQVLVATWLEALRLMHAIARGGRADTRLIAQAVKLASRTTSLTGGSAEHQAAGLLWSAIGVAALADLRTAEARNALTQACCHLRSGGHAEFLTQASGWRAVAEAMYGDLVTASQLIADAGDGTSEGEVATRPFRRQLTDLAAAYLHLARDETAAAGRLLDRCEPDGTAPGYGAPRHQVSGRRRQSPARDQRRRSPSRQAAADPAALSAAELRARQCP